MRVKKRLLYYILGTVAIFILSLTGPFRCVGVDGRMISVITGIMRLPGDVLRETTADVAFRACTSQWMYTFLPVAVSIPSASYICGELKSRFYMGAEMRMGRYKYIYSEFFYSAVSGAATVLAGLILYAVMVACIFPWIPDGMETFAGTDAGLGTILIPVGQILLYMSLYGMAVSVLASFLVFLYPNLYVDLSLLFILSYMLREMTLENDLRLPVAVMAGMAVLYGLMWRIRSERI